MSQSRLQYRPGSTRMDLRLGDGFRREGRWSEAAHCYRSALEQAPDCPAAALGLGLALIELNRLTDALDVLGIATADDTTAFEALAARGMALERAARWAEAVEAFEGALAFVPANAAILANLGRVLDRLGRRDDLAAPLARALAKSPDSPALHCLHGSLHHAFGRSEDAIAAFERMLALAPKSGDGHALLAEVKRYRAGDPHIAAMEALVGSDLPAEDHCLVRYALAKAYADLGRHDEAFALQLEANRLRRETYVYNVADTLAEIGRVKRFFTPQRMAALAGHGDPSERPVFIVGMMRSGTMLVEQILASHPRVHAIGEVPDFRLAVGETLKTYPEDLSRAGPPAVRQIAESYLRRSGAAAGDAPRIVDKTLNNDIFTALIHLALPNARIVHVVRDPVDTCLSIFATNLGRDYPFTNRLDELGRFYRAEREMMAHLTAPIPPGSLLPLRYDDLVADFEGQTRRLLHFCGLDFDPACLAFHRAPRPVATASAAQVRRPLYASSVRRWRPSPEQLAPLLEGLGPFATAG
ncbi:MAG: sulfotransferase [Proteobacteria bacterium]|nr:sulfotransferase [Pseudomonadota bacterium]